MHDQRLVRISQAFDDFPVVGYILDVGPRFFILAVVSDRIWFDGFECFRIGDVKDVGPDPNATFVQAALKKRAERRPRKPRVSVTSIEELLASAGRAFPLVTIHRDQADPDVCWIGRVLDVNRYRVSLLEINPDATWDDTPTEHQLSEITRVSFGADYENALFLVGGEPANG
jgi:hypothetical protein